MSDLLPEIAKRFSCRDYEPGIRPQDQEITLLLEAAQRSPSGCNRQPWRFVLLLDRGNIHKVAEMTFGQLFVANAACVFVVLADISVR